MNRFVYCFEGIDGSFKTTTINRLYEGGFIHNVFKSKEAKITIENSGTGFYKSFAAERRELQKAVNTKFNSALDRGFISSFAYRYGLFLFNTYPENFNTDKLNSWMIRHLKSELKRIKNLMGPVYLIQFPEGVDPFHKCKDFISSNRKRGYFIFYLPPQKEGADKRKNLNDKFIDTVLLNYMVAFNNLPIERLKI